MSAVLVLIVAATTYPPYTGPAFDGIHADATGFFYTKQIEGRWWFIDPNGSAFYMVGTDHVSYIGHRCERLGNRPYAEVTQAKYGSEEKWAQATEARLTQWGFNTLTAGHSAILEHRHFPHTRIIDMGADFALKDSLIRPNGKFPNVFSPEWPDACDRCAREHCAVGHDDPWLIGYFLDNELAWYGSTETRWGLFDEAWRWGPEHSAKRAWIDYLKTQLDGPEEMAVLWGVKVEDFKALAAHTVPHPPLTPRARDIAQGWIQIVAERYFAESEKAIRRYDPNHLILGCRFLDRCPGVWDIAGVHCDALSLNLYEAVDVDRGIPAWVVKTLEDYHRQAQKPLVLTEWSYPALDSGLPGDEGAGMRVATQAQRARCFTFFQRLLFGLPFMVGSDYFMFVDEPALGIHPGFPENTNYGLITDQDVPYHDITDAARRLNSHVYDAHAAGILPEPAVVTRELVDWLRKPPKTQRGPLTLEAGELTLDGPFPDATWRLSARGRPLGTFRPRLHQETPPANDRWATPDQAAVTAYRENRHGRAIDVTFSRVVAPSDDSDHSPRPFRSGWRFWLPKSGSTWIASQCLWVENTDTAPWLLMGIAHVLTPEIGGDPKNDEPLWPSVPDYYRRGSAWTDFEAERGIGCWFCSDKDFKCRFWKDEDGVFHADLESWPRGSADALFTMDHVILPGDRLDIHGPKAFFFPMDGTRQADFDSAVARLKRDVCKRRSGSAADEMAVEK